jgi:hypothetical protein
LPDLLLIASGADNVILRGASRAFHGAVAPRGLRPAVAPISMISRRTVAAAASPSSEIFSPQECQELMAKGYKCRFGLVL